MAATLVLVLATLAFLEGVSRSATPHEARLPLRALGVREHLVAARAGLVLLVRGHERGLRARDAHR